MKDLAIYTLTSDLHNKESVDKMTNRFLASLRLDFDYKGNNFDDYGIAPLSLIYVRTGGTEGVFKSLLPLLQRQSHHPIYLLASDQSNSLPASMEILSYLQQQGMQGEILHGATTRLSIRIHDLQQVAKARKTLQGQRLGIIGQPSDWLIASHADSNAIHTKLGVELVEISIQEVLDEFNAIQQSNSELSINPKSKSTDAVTSALPDAKRLYHALKHIVNKHQLAGFTIRCFDLLNTVHNTACLALAQLNAEGIIAGCEGDVPAALTMMISRAMLGISGFQANPSAIDTYTGTITFAHCTIPFNLVSSYELDTHFESGIGVGIRGTMPEGDVTLFKVSGDLSRYFLAEGTLQTNLNRNDLCRTQISVLLEDPADADYFLTSPIGNHHIVLPECFGEMLEEFMKSIPQS